MSQENVDALWMNLDTFRSGDFEGWIALFHEDADFIPQRAPIQGRYRGHEALRGFVADNAESFDLFEPDYDDVRDLGDCVLALGRISIRGKGSGVEYEAPSALVVTYRDGKVARFQDFG